MSTVPTEFYVPTSGGTDPREYGSSFEKRSDINVEVVQSTQSPQVTFPDGGLQAWLVAIGGWFCLFCTSGLVHCYGVFQTYYEANQLSHKTPQEIAWIGSFQLFLMFAMGLFSGRFFDMGYFRHLMIAGSGLFLLGLFLLILCREYYQFFSAQGICMGLGMGLLFLPAMTVVGHWWKLRRHLGFGIVATGSSVGGVILPIVLNRLFSQIGFGNTVRVVGYISMGCLLITNLTQGTRIYVGPN